MSDKNVIKPNKEYHVSGNALKSLVKFLSSLLEPKASIEDVLKNLLKVIPEAFPGQGKIDVLVECLNINFRTLHFKPFGLCFKDKIKLSGLEIGKLEVYFRRNHSDSEEVVAFSDEFNHEVKEFIHLLVSHLGLFVEGIQHRCTKKGNAPLFHIDYEHSCDGYIITDQFGKIILWNYGAEKVFSILSEEAIGKPLNEMIPDSFPHFTQLRQSDFKKTVKALGIIGKTRDLMGKRKDGRVFPVSLLLSPIEYDHHLSYLGILWDRTTIKLEEHVLNDDIEKFRSLFLESRDTIYFTTIDGKFIDINPAGLMLFGFESKEEALRTNIATDLYVRRDDRERFKTLINKNGTVKHFQVEFKKVDGTKLTVLLSGSLMKNKDGVVVGYKGIIWDITKRVQNEQALIQMNKELRTMNQKLKEAQVTIFNQSKLAAIGQLAAGMAHEINNPLAYISSNFQTLEKYSYLMRDFIKKIEHMIESDLDGLCKTPEAFVKSVDTMKKNLRIKFILEDINQLFEESKDGVSRIASIINNLRSFSRIDAGDKIEKYELNDAIFNTLSVAQNELKSTANVKTILADIPPVECRGDEINQVLLNIILNAVHAIGTQHRKEKGNITITSRSDNDHVYLEIEDDGPGIPPENLSKIFDPFFTTKSVGEGTGLGLHISHNIIVNKYRGTLDVKSVEGSGSSFFIKLPIKLKTNQSNEK